MPISEQFIKDRNIRAKGSVEENPVEATGGVEPVTLPAADVIMPDEIHGIGSEFNSQLPGRVPNGGYNGQVLTKTKKKNGINYHWEEPIVFVNTIEERDQLGQTAGTNPISHSIIHVREDGCTYKYDFTENK